MSEIVNLESVVHEENPTDIWNKHIQGAVSKFLKTAVVIDNQPWIRQSTSEEIIEVDTVEESGFGDERSELISPDTVPIESIHDLDLRSVSDVFSERGIACAFVLPDDLNKNQQEKKNRALLAAKVSDLVVIDWYLESKDSSLTLQILEDIARADTQENGRLRLICIYTGEPLNEAIFNDVKEHLKRGGVSLENMQGADLCAHSSSTIVVIKNKSETSAKKLPDELIKLFSKFANGLIPSFALAAVGAIRRNTHHMLTRFGASIDSAYISNRLITNPPGDVAELMRELMVAECDNALGLERIADEYLEKKTISLWLDAFSDKLQPVSYDVKSGNENKNITINREVLDCLLHHGIGDNDFKNNDGEKIRFPEIKRNKVSEAISGDVEKSKKAQNEFSRLVAFRREAYGSTTRLMNPGWFPSLTTGTILKFNEGGSERYLMCFTPACDTLRIQGSRPFVFIEGSECRRKYNLVVTNSKGDSVGVYFDKKYPVVKTFHFNPDNETQRVRATKEVNELEATKFFLNSVGDMPIKFEWVGEIRYSRATSEMASLANIWMRIGIVDSEYLRLAAKGHFKF
ncbi:response regulator receiver domain [Serratia marcescens]|uniref:response regulator receiver domain n=3 Tax=Serratia marcescens TaxID=615 RepID=UPI00351855DA